VWFWGFRTSAVHKDGNPAIKLVLHCNLTTVYIIGLLTMRSWELTASNTSCSAASMNSSWVMVHSSDDMYELKAMCEGWRLPGFRVWYVKDGGCQAFECGSEYHQCEHHVWVPHGLLPVALNPCANELKCNAAKLFNEKRGWIVTCAGDVVSVDAVWLRQWSFCFAWMGDEEQTERTMVEVLS
jgi:hypothetical protein